VRFSLRVNNDLSTSELTRLAMAAEVEGFDQLWVSNDLFLRSAPALVGALSAVTSSIKLGIAVMNPYSMHVSELAMIAATLQEISNGRFLMGLGAGSAEFLGWAGIWRTRPLTTTAQAVSTLRAMLGHLDVDAALLPDWYSPQSELRFALIAPVPVYVGAMGPKMLAMAGRVADGALPLLYPPEHFAVARDQVITSLLGAGRAEAHFDLPACFWVSIDTDSTAARDALAQKLAYYGPSISPILLAEVGLVPADFEQAAMLAQRGLRAVDMIDDRMLSLGIAGDPTDVVKRCEGLLALGARHLSFGPPLGPDPVLAVRILGSEVLPAIRESLRWKERS
jgi:5,10-methylenetetrahydromethanopterin reductase